MVDDEAMEEMKVADEAYHDALMRAAGGDVRVYEQLRYYTANKDRPANVQAAYAEYVRVTRQFLGFKVSVS